MPTYLCKKTAICLCELALYRREAQNVPCIQLPRTWSMCHHLGGFHMNMNNKTSPTDLDKFRPDPVGPTIVQI